MKLIYKNKEYDLSDVEAFVHKKYGEGWYHITSILSSQGEFRTFEDKFNNHFEILYKKNIHNVFVPYEIVRISVNF